MNPIVIAAERHSRRTHFYGRARLTCRPDFLHLLNFKQMKPTLQPGLQYELKFRVPANKMVPALYPEASEFQEMPHVFATGFMVGLLEWACLKAIKPHLDWPAEQSVGTHIDVSHLAATPAGFEVTVAVNVTEVQGKR